MKIKNLSFLLLTLITLTACNDYDDIISIFTGKTWKLTVIHYPKDKPDLSYWRDKEGKIDDDAFNKSLERKKEKGFFVKFDGAKINGKIEGTFTGAGYNSSFSGKWLCLENSRNINITEFQINGSDHDILAKAFINAMINVDSYRKNSDINNLHLNFKEGELYKYMSFTVTQAQ